MGQTWWAGRCRSQKGAHLPQARGLCMSASLCVFLSVHYWAKHVGITHEMFQGGRREEKGVTQASLSTRSC